MSIELASVFKSVAEVVGYFVVGPAVFAAIVFNLTAAGRKSRQDFVKIFFGPQPKRGKPHKPPTKTAIPAAKST